MGTPYVPQKPKARTAEEWQQTLKGMEEVVSRLQRASAHHLYELETQLRLLHAAEHQLESLRRRIEELRSLRTTPDD